MRHIKLQHFAHTDNGKISIRYMTDEGDNITKPTHYISLFKGYERLVSFDGKTKKEVKNKIAQWLINNKIVDLIIPKYDLNF